VTKIVALDPAVSRAVEASLGPLEPAAADLGQAMRAIDAGLAAAVAPDGLAGTEIAVEEALALRQWAGKLGDRALPYVVGKLAMAGAKPHVLQAALTGEAFRSEKIHSSFQYDGSGKIKLALFDVDGTLRVAPSER
jgi:hypothetical protein